MRIAVIGAGYVGLVTGVSLARSSDHRITLVERSSSRRSELLNGRLPIEEPGLEEAFAAARSRIVVQRDLEHDDRPDLVFVCVGTPTSEDGEPDLRQLHSAAEALRERPALHVSVRSTLPPGTSAHLPAMLGRADGSRLSTNPEFLRQGSAMKDHAAPSRIVIGIFNETSTEHLNRVRTVYEPIQAPRLEMSVAAAELVKNVSNGFLALKLSFVNEVATLSEEFGVDVDEILEGIVLDPRIGGSYMQPGMGFGGSCLPKELQVLAVAGRRQGVPMHVARAVAQVNREQQDRFTRNVLKELPTSDGQVGLLGLSYKAFTDDLRGSPAVYVARRLIEEGHIVTAFDPAVRPSRAGEVIPGIRTVGSIGDVFDGADAVVIGTDWPEFAAFDLRSVRPRVRRALVFDGRNLLDPEAVQTAGFGYRGVGRVPRDSI